MLAESPEKRGIIRIAHPDADLIDTYLGTAQKIPGKVHPGFDQLLPEADTVKRLHLEELNTARKAGIRALTLDEGGIPDTAAGRLAIAKKYDGADYFHDGLLLVKLNGKYGFIDKSGNEVIPCKYDYVQGFHEGLALVKQNYKIGFIDKTGNQVIPCIYDVAWEFLDGLTRVKQNNKWGFVDKNGKLITPVKYDNIKHIVSLGIIKAIVKDENGDIDFCGNKFSLVSIKIGGVEDDNDSE